MRRPHVEVGRPGAPLSGGPSRLQRWRAVFRLCRLRQQSNAWCCNPMLGAVTRRLVLCLMPDSGHRTVDRGDVCPRLGAPLCGRLGAVGAPQNSSRDQKSERRDLTAPKAPPTRVATGRDRKSKTGQKWPPLSCPPVGRLRRSHQLRETSVGCEPKRREPAS